MRTPEEDVSNRLWRLGKRATCLIGLALVLSGCNKSLLPKQGESDEPSSDSKFMIVQMQALEQRQSSGFYDLIYSNKVGTQASDFRLAQGKFLMNDQGVFKYEQPKSDPERSFWVYFNPQSKLMVGFPKLKSVYSAPASILDDPQLTAVQAAYDAVRLILGLSDVWSNPAKGTATGKSRGAVSLEESTRQFQWTIEFEGGGHTPIASMVCQDGFKRILSLARTTTRIPVATGGSGGAPEPGQPVVTNQWEFVFAGSPGTTDVIFNPFPPNTLSEEQLAQSFKEPEVDSSLKSQELTPALILNWLNLR